jgi:phospholipid/cholesterol/gamma-HCH transport system substrate-binding protein
MMHNSKKVEIWVGCFLLLGIAALLILVMKVADVKSFTSQQNYQLKAYFDNIGSLKVRSPVKVGGVVIGRVSEINLDLEYYVPIVTLQINHEFGYFPETSSAKILTSGLIGEQYISFEPGFMMEGVNLLQDGDWVEETQSALVIEDLIGQFLYGDKAGDK